jgi:hypothetical protein
LLFVAGATGAAERPAANPTTYRTWIDEMKGSPRGPFVRIRWFCEDGSVHPPRPYACRDHGGGLQHGEWSQHALTLRGAGYEIATIFAELDADRFVGANADLGALEQILLERFLVGIDDGWIFRGARSYRGAFQVEDEQAGANRILLGMLADSLWLQPERYTLLREAVRLFPLQHSQATSSDVRNLATRIAQREPEFEPLRAKIHSMPDARDARRVRAYASGRQSDEPDASYEQLAAAIDQLYTATSAASEVLEVARSLPVTSLTTTVKTLATQLAAANDPFERFSLAAQLLESLRQSLPEAPSAATRLALLEASLRLEDEAYAAGNTALTGLDGASREGRLLWLDRTTAAVYGAGLIGARELAAVRESIRRLRSASPLVLSSYRDELRYLSRVPEWSLRWLRFHFGESMDRLSHIEPLAHRYVRDRLRGSPLIVYGAALDTLLLDANGLAGVEHELFGERVGSGLRALNPGLARGVLSTADPRNPDARYEATGIYLLPETTADLPPVSGILTEGEGSSLSHIQLLARNLGIPNLVVGYHLLPRVRAELGKRVVLAVSPNGVAQLTFDGPQWDPVFGEERVADDVVLEVDLEKLDLEKTDLVSLSQLRATDSGRMSGPKGAKLGELKHAFGDAVPPGLVVPFGTFRKLLENPIEPGGPPAWEWMQKSYAAIARSPNDEERQRLVSSFLERMRKFVMNTDLDAAFTQGLRTRLAETFGKDGTYGAFVRSDTNVEDLPGFSGAGLNLTVPNVVGFDNVLTALRRVWASPFTERAYAWRQARMRKPEYVFPAVLIQYSFPAEKSGVLVTTDLERGEAGWLTVAVNEGVGGAVAGQEAESLRIRAADGEVQFLARATAARRMLLAPQGGVTFEPASGTPAVLTDDEIAQLVRLAAAVPTRFPSLRNAGGKPAPADIEFAFRGGELALLQIRPLVENRAVERNRYISGLDATMRQRVNQPVDLKAIPVAAPQ